MKKYLVLMTCYLSDLAIHCKEGSVVLLPSDYKLPETKKGYRPKFKYLGEVDGSIPAGVDPALAEVEQVLNDAGISRNVAGTYFKEVGATTPEEKLVAAKELAQELSTAKDEVPVDDIYAALTPEVKEMIGKVKGLGEKSAAKLFHEKQAITPEAQKALLTEKLKEQE